MAAKSGPDANTVKELGLSEEEVKRLLDAEEEKRKLRRRQKKGRIRELEEVRRLSGFFVLLSLWCACTLWA